MDGINRYNNLNMFYASYMNRVSIPKAGSKSAAEKIEQDTAEISKPAYMAPPQSDFAELIQLKFENMRAGK